MEFRAIHRPLRRSPHVIPENSARPPAPLSHLLHCLSVKTDTSIKYIGSLGASSISGARLHGIFICIAPQSVRRLINGIFDSKKWLVQRRYVRVPKSRALAFCNTFAEEQSVNLERLGLSRMVLHLTTMGKEPYLRQDLQTS